MREEYGARLPDQFFFARPKDLMFCPLYVPFLLTLLLQSLLATNGQQLLPNNTHSSV